MAEHRSATVRWCWTIQVNKSLTLRMALGTWLRRLADRLDGRETLAVEIFSDPRLSRAQKRQILMQGVKRIMGATKSEVIDTAREIGMQRLRPDLFGAKK